MAAPDIKFVDTKLPLALKWQKTDEQGHAGGFTVASITKLEAKDNQLWATGHFLDSAEAKEAIGQIEAGVTAPSVEIVVRESIASDKDGNTVTEDQVKKMAASGEKMVMKWNSVELVGVTLVSVPNFRETKVILGDAVENAVADEAVTAAVIQMHTDSFPVEAFTVPEYDELTPIHITKEGLVVGHLASWDVCHVGVQAQTGQCRTAPRSQSGYAEFHQSHVMTEDAEQIRVGRLTVGGGHGPAGRGMKAAVEHYDDVATTWAYVRAMNGAHGIWVSGVVNPRANETMVREAMNAPHSGHWEKVAGGLELIAAHAVNTPGFPIMKQINDSHGPVGLVASAFAPRVDVAELEEAVDLVAAIAEQAVEAYKASIAEAVQAEKVALVASAAEAAVAEYQLQLEAERIENTLKQVREAAKQRRLARMAAITENGFPFKKTKPMKDAEDADKDTDEDLVDEPDADDDDQPDEAKTETVRKKVGSKKPAKAY